MTTSNNLKQALIGLEAARVIMDDAMTDGINVHGAIATYVGASDNLLTALEESQPGIVSDFVKRFAKPDPSKGGVPYWPHCTDCKVPFEFSEEEPFAWCKCPGTIEWGHAGRPLPWVTNPHTK